MKKRIVLIAGCFVLLGAGLLILADPHRRQGLFGPTVKGEPLYAWQQRFRLRYGDNARAPSFWDDLRARIGAAPERMWVIEPYPNADPEMLPVLLSLADDPDERIRNQVALDLRRMLPDADARAALLRLLEDRSDLVRLGAIMSVRQSALTDAKFDAALDRLLDAADPSLRVWAAHVLIERGKSSPRVKSALFEQTAAASESIRLLAVGDLSKNISTDDEIRTVLMGRAKSDPSELVKRHCIHQLRHFGKRAVPSLVEMLLDPSQKPLHGQVKSTLLLIGPKAIAEVSGLDELLADAAVMTPPMVTMFHSPGRVTPMPAAAPAVKND